MLWEVYRSKRWLCLVAQLGRNANSQISPCLFHADKTRIELMLFFCISLPLLIVHTASTTSHKQLIVHLMKNILEKTKNDIICEENHFLTCISLISCYHCLSRSNAQIHDLLANSWELVKLTCDLKRGSCVVSAIVCWPAKGQKKVTDFYLERKL